MDNLERYAEQIRMNVLDKFKREHQLSSEGAWNIAKKVVPENWEF